LKHDQRKYKCSVNGCANWGYAKGLCHKHYERNRKFGTPTPTKEDGFNERPIITTTRKERREQKAKQRRLNLKLRSIAYKGGACILCGYNRCSKALDFHHVDPSQKEFNLSGAYDKYKKTWKELMVELDKCVLLCSNCHKELEAGFFEDDFVNTVARPPKSCALIKVCSITGCENEVMAKGLCTNHYQRKLSGKSVEYIHINKGKVCSVENCNVEAHTKGMCRIHYRRMKAHGTIEEPITGRWVNRKPPCNDGKQPY